MLRQACGCVFLQAEQILPPTTEGKAFKGLCSAFLTAEDLLVFMSASVIKYSKQAHSNVRRTISVVGKDGQ